MPTPSSDLRPALLHHPDLAPAEAEVDLRAHGNTWPLLDLPEHPGAWAQPTYGVTITEFTDNITGLMDGWVLCKDPRPNPDVPAVADA